MVNELSLHTSHQTPIEIALGIDSQGRTTAKKLYEFLELDRSHYNRWCNTNILKNKFAEEGTDYWKLATDGEFMKKTGRGNTADYKLTASFAKKLAMVAGGERGEEAREYFLKTEDALKEVALHRNDELTQLKSQVYDLLMANKELSQKLSRLEQRQDDIEKKMPSGLSDNERETIGECLVKLGQAMISKQESDENKKNGKFKKDDLPLTDEQLECVRNAMRKSLKDNIGRLDKTQFKRSTFIDSVNQMIRMDIQNAIKNEIGVRHTLAKQSQYEKVLWIAEHHKINEELIQRIYSRTNPYGR